ncbi:hypothetical protein P389DRAFT_111989 [Cystobasidium minutum MCA 4210]|uniref:uncharacterized protein n=1 Tax=Cystobasidium minutum MCA 4210 TaxID=1397322 RepID=UPI0034CD41CA|eukprot:jgi/Rhomi1/111989/CE111988_128
MKRRFSFRYNSLAITTYHTNLTLNMPYDIHGNQLRGGKLKAYKEDGEIDENGIYMPGGTNIEPEKMSSGLKGGRLQASKQGQVVSDTAIYMPDGTDISEEMRPLYLRMKINKSSQIKINVDDQGNIKVDYIGWPGLENRKMQRLQVNEEKVHPPVELDGYVYCYQCWKNNTLIHWFPRPVGQAPNMAAKGHGYCGHCAQIYARRNDAHRERLAQERAARRAAQLARKPETKICTLSERQIDLFEEHDRLLELAREAILISATWRPRLRDTWWGSHGQEPVASSSMSGVSNKRKQGDRA